MNNTNYILMTSNIELHPEFKESLEKLNNLKKDLTKLIQEEDELKFHICKNIEARYMLKIGYIEYKLFERQLILKIIKREITLIQKYINQDKKVDLEEIKKQIDVEYEDYIFKLNKQLIELKELAERGKKDSLSEEDKEKLKDLYKKLILHYHPDLNKNLSKEDEETFYRIVDAYENGDLDTLNLIYELNLDKLQKKKYNSIDELKEQIKTLNIRINLTKDRIDEIKSSHPYNKINLLEDEERVKRNKRILEKQVIEYDQLILEYSKKLKNLKESLND